MHRVHLGLRSQLGIKLEKTADPTKMAEELLAKIRGDQE